jgi:hypothetical protein
MTQLIKKYNIKEFAAIAGLIIAIISFVIISINFGN